MGCFFPYSSGYGYPSYRRDPRSQVASGWVAVVVGVVLLVVAGGLALNDQHFEAVARPATGTIVRYVQHYHSSRYSHYYYYNPVVSYSVNGTTFERECSTGEAGSQGSTGVPVQVLYDPGQPGHCRLNQDGQAYGDVWGPGLLGLVVALAGLFSVATGQSGLRQQQLQQTWSTLNAPAPRYADDQPRYPGPDAPPPPRDLPAWNPPAGDSGVSPEEEAQAAREISDPHYWQNLDR